MWDYRKTTLLKNLTKDSGASGGGDVTTKQGGGYLYCGQFCTSSVVVAGGTGSNSVEAVSLDSSEVRCVVFV